MQRQTLQVDTRGRTFIDLSRELSSFCRELGDGLVNVFVPHATAGLAVFELGSGSEQDLSEVLQRLLPRDDRWRHRHGSSGHGADHVLPALLSPSVSIPVAEGSPMLGRWQSVVLVDTNVDNSVRSVVLTFLRSA